MRSRFAFGLFIVACIAAAPLLAQENALEKEPYGYFRPAAKFANEFADVAELHLSGAGEYGAKANPPFLGTLETKGRAPKKFRIRERNIAGLKIDLSTETLGGVSYQFSGTFARADFHAGGVPLDEVMLSGTLTKLRDGKTIATTRVRFAFEAGG